MRKTLSAVLLLAAVSCASWAAGQEVQGFTIRYYDKKVYFQGDPIQVEVVVSNESASGQTLRFKVADNQYFTLDFDVRSTTNIALEHAKQFTTQRNSDQPVFFREVSLQPGEKYGFVVDLAAYASFTSSGLYVVQASFFPELWKGQPSPSWASNRLSLNLKPPVVTAEEKAKVEAETGALISRAAIPPDEVVAFTIQARQKSQWEKFYLYLDLESLLRRNPEKDTAFRRSTEEEQRRMLEQFRQELRQAKIDQEISVIPSSFEIQKTSYDAAEGTVQVLEKFKYIDYTELKSYIYHLKKVDRFWIITDYEIKNLGTE